MTAPSNLIERLGKATGPDRELDAEIALACGWTKGTVGYFCGPIVTWRKSGQFSADHPPAFTASVAIALTLLPPGTDYVLACVDGKFDASAGPADTLQSVVAHGATASIAVATAALMLLATLNPKS